MLSNISPLLQLKDSMFKLFQRLVAEIRMLAFCIVRLVFDYLCNKGTAKGSNYSNAAGWSCLTYSTFLELKPGFKARFYTNICNTYMQQQQELNNLLHAEKGFRVSQNRTIRTILQLTYTSA